MTAEVAVRSHDQDGVTFVELEGEITSVTSAALQGRILPLIGRSRTTLIDLTGVPYISSAGLRTLLLVHRQALREESRTILVGLSEEVRFVMSSTGFLGFFDIRDKASFEPGAAGR
ncbi:MULTISPECIES: STAS domain-containing protein [unclassified Streptomyces]|uniref:STAS domain-containing protein n=1 Tax=unclassified Streptomyces TaxID=2593676 RepID=UPI00366377E8